MFITFEGLDFSGKSTQVKLLVERLSRENHTVVALRDPGGTGIGEKIRAVLLDKNVSDMADFTELFLYSASRAQLVQEVIKPALAGGMIVVLDRFYDSTTAYQGWGRGLPLDAINVINKSAAGGLAPDLTFFVDIPVSEVEKRMHRLKSGADRIEQNGEIFYERVHQGYMQLMKEEKRFHVINGLQPVDDIAELIWEKVQQNIASRVQS